jgi:maltose alpha-D-glucosyltransferase/alpha-amylase
MSDIRPEQRPEQRAEERSEQWFNDPQWYKDAIVYQLHVKAFFDSNQDGIGDFGGLAQKLDYLQELGVNTLWLLPFYPSPMRDDGYDIADYREIYRDYGTLDDFKAFIREAHRRGLKVITELVVNHTSDQHPWFQEARRAPPGSPARDFYVWSDTDKKFPETRIIFTDTETSNWAWDPVANAYYWHRFFSHQPDLNHNNPKVVDAVIDVMRFWLDIGVDGMRLDAIPYLCVREGTTNENLPETHEVLKRMRAVVDAEYQGRLFLAEANQWPEDVREYFGDGDECHMAYHFPLMPRMYMALALEDRYPLTEILRQTPDIPENCQWAIFLRNHDELTLEMVTDSERDYMYRMYAKEPRMRVNVGIRRRLAPLLENDPDRIKLMNSMLLSMPGSPIVYYGDEIGMGDNFFLGDRNGVRTPMQWSPDRNAGFSRTDPQRLYLPAIMDAVYGYESVNVESQSRDRSSLLNWTKRVLAIRKQYRAFGRGSLEIIRPANRKIFAYARTFDRETILCVANLSQTAQAVELDLSKYRGKVPVEMLGRHAFPPIGDLPYLLTLQAYGFFWLHLSNAESPDWHIERLPPSELNVLVLSSGVATFTAEDVGANDRSVVKRAIRGLEIEVLPEFLRARRWFAAKGKNIVSTSIGPRAVWRTNRGEWLICLPEVRFSDEDRQNYLLPLAVSWEDGSDPATQRSASWALAKVRQHAKAGLLLDAFADPGFCLSVAESIGEGETIKFGDGDVHFEATDVYAQLASRGLEPVNYLGAEQSNISVVLGEAMMLKGYRRLRAGVNPEIEMARYLTEVLQFPHIAPLAGVIEYRPPEGPPITMGAAFGFVRNQGDAWTYTLNHLERFANTLLQTAEKAEQQPHELYLSQIQTLGRRVGELHAALATPLNDAAFSPEPVTTQDLASWKRSIHLEAEQTLKQLERSVPTLTETVRSNVVALLEAYDSLTHRIDELALSAPHSMKTRYHGDLHLGQVLVTADDFLIIDFEGEPGRSFEERRIKHSPLRDVAGMLRSFDYARAVGLDRALHGRPDARSTLEPGFSEWQQRSVQAFLAGYQFGLGQSAPAPSKDRGSHDLVELFQIEKALYEVRYELDNRPAWVSVPIAGILSLVKKTATPG